MLKNVVGGLINALGVEVLGVDSVLGLYIARFKSQSGGISGGRGGVESSDKEGDRDGVLEKEAAMTLPIFYTCNFTMLPQINMNGWEAHRQ